MDLTDQDVQRILDILDQSRFDYLQIEDGDLKIVASKSGVLPEGVAPAAPVAQTAAPAASAAPPAPAAAPASSAPAPTAGAGPAKSAAAGINRDGLVAVNAPMIGTFYRAPEPGAPPFVDVGTSINPDSTLGLIEVMKVFNGVSSNVTGVIEHILIENAEFVEFGQELFLVRPEA